MTYESNNFILEYTTDDLDYIEDMINNIKNVEEKLSNFFNIDKLSKQVYIRIINNTQIFTKEAMKDMNQYNGNIPSWIIGYAINNNNKAQINILSLKYIKEKETHKNYSEKNMIELIAHEYAHIFHFEYNDHKKCYRCISESFATIISNKYSKNDLKLDCSLEELLNANIDYRNYFTLGYFIMNNYSKEYILELLKDKEIQDSEIPKLYEETLNYLKSKKRNN